jgi:hypothetical protein
VESDEGAEFHDFGLGAVLLEFGIERRVAARRIEVHLVGVAQRPLLGRGETRTALVVVHARHDRRLVESVIQRPGRAQAGEVGVAGPAREQNADDFLQLVIDGAFGVRKQQRAHERLRVSGHARKDAGKKRVRHAEALAARDQLGELVVADFLARKRCDVRHGHAPPAPASETGLSP